jgi:hypothetical protein
MTKLSRKSFFKRLSVGVAGLAVADYGKATPSVFSAISANKFATAGTTGVVKITDVVTYVHPKATFIKIETDAGISEAGHLHVPQTAGLGLIVNEKAMGKYRVG